MLKANLSLNKIMALQPLGQAGGEGHVSRPVGIEAPLAHRHERGSLSPGQCSEERPRVGTWWLHWVLGSLGAPGLPQQHGRNFIIKDIL